MDPIELALLSKGKYQGYEVWYLAPTHEGENVALMQVARDSFVVKRAGRDRAEFEKEIGKTARAIRARCKDLKAVEIDIRVQHGQHVKVADYQSESTDAS